MLKQAILNAICVLDSDVVLCHLVALKVPISASVMTMRLLNCEPSFISVVQTLLRCKNKCKKLAQGGLDIIVHVSSF